MSRAEVIEAKIPQSINELTKIRRRLETNQPIKSGELAPVVAAIETTYHQLSAMMRRKASEEWDASYKVRR